MGHTVDSIVSVLTAIVGLAIVSVLVSKNANTSGVITAGGSAFSTVIGAAVSPISGTGLSSSNSIYASLEPG